MKTIAFFNNKGGVGKTSLVYHVAWMLSILKERVLIADLDPQANVTSMCLSPEAIESLWDTDSDRTMFGAIRPLMAGEGDISFPDPVRVSERLYVVPGDLQLSLFEDQLSETWPKSLGGDERAFRVTTAFHRILSEAGRKFEATICLIDVGPNLGAINRASLVAADFVVIPIAPDLFSIRGLANVGPTMQRWRRDWQKRLEEWPAALKFDKPSGTMVPLGYVVSRYTIFASGAVRAYQRWLDRAPAIYRTAVEGVAAPPGLTIDTDDRRIAQLKDYRSLMSMAQEARKPMFLLRAADGAIGGHQAAVKECGEDFRKLANEILQRMDRASGIASSMSKGLRVTSP
jgi:chromosome partitioning protein